MNTEKPNIHFVLCVTLLDPQWGHLFKMRDMIEATAWLVESLPSNQAARV